MSVEADIRTHLLAQLTDEPGIFLQGLPAQPDDAVAILSTGGPEPVLVMGPTVVKRNLTFQVLVRGSLGEGEAVEALAQLIHTELQVLGTTVIDGTTYDYITAAAEPFQVPVDGNARPVWSANYAAIKDGS